MNKVNRAPALFVAACTVCSTFALTATASNLPLADTTISSGTTSYGTDPTLSSGNYYYGNSIAAGTGQTAVAGSSSGFFDDYVFTISSSSVNSVASTINLGNSQINNLQASLFTYTPGEAMPLYGYTLPPGSVQVDGWSTAFSSGSYTVIDPVALSAGSYVLEIRGTAAGSGGGSYSGVLNVSAVPLPPTLSLMLVGLGGVGFWTRRRWMPHARA